VAAQRCRRAGPREARIRLDAVRMVAVRAVAGALWTSYDASFPAIWVEAMKRRSRAGGQPVKARPRKAVTLKRRTAPKAVRRHGRSAGNLQEQLDLRTRELNVALEQQTATSEVLEVISSSPGDLEPVFAAMLEKAARICDAAFGNIYRWDGDVLHLVGTHNTPPALAEARRRSPIRPRVSRTPSGRMLATKVAVHVADLAAEEGYTERRDPAFVAAVELGGGGRYSLCRC
jgi:hypothetical protein